MSTADVLFFNGMSIKSGEADTTLLARQQPSVRKTVNTKRYQIPVRTMTTSVRKNSHHERSAISTRTNDDHLGWCRMHCTDIVSSKYVFRLTKAMMRLQTLSLSFTGGMAITTSPLSSLPFHEENLSANSRSPDGLIVGSMEGPAH